MKFEDYQERAKETDKLGSKKEDRLTVALYGLAGEAGSVLTLYKKRLRDGNQYTRFIEKVKEELGDIIWYVSAIASMEDISLAEIAAENLEKTGSRWIADSGDSWINFDEHFPPEEQLPFRFTAQFIATVDAGKPTVRVEINGVPCGARLTDNAYDDDGYRFHDIFHMTAAALLGWSPVLRALLQMKRKSDSETDVVEDGGRAIAIEEALAALVFSYAYDHNLLEGIKSLDWNLLDLCRALTRNLEVGARATAEWERTIFTAFELWRSVTEHQGGWIQFDRENRQAVYSQNAPA